MPAIEVFPSVDAVVDAAADHFELCFRRAVDDKGDFVVALAGGSSPERLYRHLADTRESLPWNRAKVFVSDERYVGLGAPESNFGMIRRSLLDHVDAHAFPVPVELGTSEESAQAYANQIRHVVGDPPVFDLILLGMGEDGHTASMFPGKPVLHSTAWVEAAPHGELPPPVPRITFTFPLIRQARSVLLVATGANKGPALARWTRGTEPIDQLPVIGLEPLAGRLRVLTDIAEGIH